MIHFCNRVKAPNQLKMTILQQMRFPTKRFRNGYSFPCNRSKEFKTRLSSEVIQKMSAIIKYRALKPYFDLFTVLRNQRVSGTAAAPTYK